MNFNTVNSCYIYSAHNPRVQKTELLFKKKKKRERESLEEFTKLPRVTKSGHSGAKFYILFLFHCQFSFHYKTSFLVLDGGRFFSSKG